MLHVFSTYLSVGWGGVGWGGLRSFRALRVCVCVWRVCQFPCYDSRGGSGRGVGNLVIAVLIGSGGRLSLSVLM